MNKELTFVYGPAPALRKLGTFCWKEWTLSALWVAIMSATYFGRGQWDKIALWGCLMLAVLLAQHAATALRWVLPRDAGWSWCWSGMPLVLLLTSILATTVYAHIAHAQHLRALTGIQMFGSAFVFSGLAIGIPLLLAQREARIAHLAELERLALAAELKSLQAQVEPHFLYNTLANTRYLARHAPERAVEMLDHLIAYLRSALPDMRTPSSTLGRECELARHYLALMEIRFGERLATHIDCPEALREAPVPPMMLMSLVENAIQHGVEPKPGAVAVSVKATADEDGCLSIVVRDDGAGLQRDAGAALIGSGVGLRNVRERLQALFGARAAFDLRQAADGATEAILLLPLLPSEGRA